MIALYVIVEVKKFKLKRDKTENRKKEQKIDVLIDSDNTRYHFHYLIDYVKDAIFFEFEHSVIITSRCNHHILILICLTLSNMKQLCHTACDLQRKFHLYLLRIASKFYQTK